MGESDEMGYAGWDAHERRRDRVRPGTCGAAQLRNRCTVFRRHGYQPRWVSQRRVADGAGRSRTPDSRGRAGATQADGIRSNGHGRCTLAAGRRCPQEGDRAGKTLVCGTGTLPGDVHATGQCRQSKLAIQAGMRHRNTITLPVLFRTGTVLWNRVSRSGSGASSSSYRRDSACPVVTLRHNEAILWVIQISTLVAPSNGDEQCNDQNDCYYEKYEIPDHGCLQLSVLAVLHCHIPILCPATRICG